MYGLAAFGGALVLFAIIGIGLLLVPGLIANKRNHPYKGVIWALAIVGSLFWGLGWIAALVWSLWPQDQSLIDPVVGNTFARQNTSAGSNLASKLAELDHMLASGQINQDEYQALRKKALGL